MSEKFVLVTHDKFKFFLSEKEYKEVIAAVLKGDEVILLEKCLVPLSKKMKPTILTFKKWYDSENDRLATYGKKICRKCSRVREIESRECGHCARSLSRLDTDTVKQIDSQAYKTTTLD